MEIKDDAKNEEDSNPYIIAYAFDGDDSDSRFFDIVPATVGREWMDKTPERFAYRCLPLTMANTLGWTIRTKFPFMVYWDGTDHLNGITVAFPDSDSTDIPHLKKRIGSHFGSGIITFNVPWHFRTSRGHNLLVTGPFNQYKHGISPLTGVVETDWLPFTFTMNWKFTEAMQMIRFDAGDVICQFFPYPRGYPEKFTALSDQLASNSGIFSEYKKWGNSRNEFNKRLKDPHDSGVTLKDWQKNYFRGEHKDGTKFEDHQTKFSVCPFKRLPKGKET